MPLIGIHPKTEQLENWAGSKIEEVRERIKTCVHLISGFPTTDVIVSLHKCDVRNSDPDGADFTIYIDTNPNEELEKNADALRNAIAAVIINAGFATKRDVEVWPRFLPGSWCLIRDNKIVDTVDHKK